jgi:hypothetical protein
MINEGFTSFVYMQTEKFRLNIGRVKMTSSKREKNSRQNKKNEANGGS